MNNLHCKTLGILVGLFGMVMSIFACIYAYQYSMWYEMLCCIGGCVMSVICGYLLYGTTDEEINNL